MRWWGALFLLVFSGCQPIRPYCPPPIPVEEETLAAEGRIQTDAVVAKWWEAFGDRDLTDLIEEAMVHNKSIVVACQRLLQARATAIAARYDRFPSATLSGEYRRRMLSEEDIQGKPSRRYLNVYSADVDSQWEIDLFSRVSEGIAAENALADSLEADLEDAYVSLAAEVASSYLSLRGSQLRLAIARENAHNQEKSYELTQTLSRGGRGTALDVSRAKTQLGLTLATIPPLNAEITETIHRLSILTGKPPSYLKERLRASRELPSLPETVSVGNVEELVRRRPDIRSKERLVRAAVAKYNVEVAEFFPKLSLNGSLGFISTAFSSIGATAIRAFVGPRLNWRAFDLGRVRRQVDARDAKALEAIAVYEQTVLEALEEIQSALSRFTQEEKRRLVLLSVALSAKTASELARRRFDQGLDRFLDVLDAERTQLEAQDALAVSETEVTTRLVAIYKALGGGWVCR